jgi:hypothetical protein
MGWGLVLRIGKREDFGVIDKKILTHLRSRKLWDQD